VKRNTDRDISRIAQVWRHEHAQHAQRARLGELGEDGKLCQAGRLQYLPCVALKRTKRIDAATAAGAGESKLGREQGTVRA
jgi:hypothetical protein